MRKILLVMAIALVAAPAMADYHVAGDFNGWDAAANVMTDLGGGIWTVDLSSVGGRHEFKVTDGTWDNNWPGSGNSWFLGDGDGNITITFNANVIDDGWNGNWGRIGTSTDPGTWTAVGDWQGWDNTGNSMTALGGGIYQYKQALAPGWYQVQSGRYGNMGRNRQ